MPSDILFPYRSPFPQPHPDPAQQPETDPKRTPLEGEVWGVGFSDEILYVYHGPHKHYQPTYMFGELFPVKITA